MNPIELGKAISEYGIPIITAVMLILVVGLVWYLIKRQTKREEKHDKQQDEDRKFHRDLITNHLTGLQDIGTENSKLNSQSMLLQKDMIEHLEEHNDYCVKASKKIIESFSAICDKLNGKTPIKEKKANGRK